MSIWWIVPDSWVSTRPMNQETIAQRRPSARSERHWGRLHCNPVGGHGANFVLLISKGRNWFLRTEFVCEQQHWLDALIPMNSTGS